MDIADAFFNQHSLAWLSHEGVTFPQPFSDRGADWLRTFGGGLLTTCGLTHVGGPETDEHGKRGLHDRISNIPAETARYQATRPRQRSPGYEHQWSDAANAGVWPHPGVENEPSPARWVKQPSRCATK